MVRCVGAETTEVGIGELHVPVIGNQHPVQSDQAGVVAFVAPRERPPMQVQILELKVRHRAPETGQVPPIDSCVVLVRFIEDQVEVATDCPWTLADVPDGFKFLEK